MTKRRPAQAADIAFILDTIAQILSILTTVQQILADKEA
jgi:hypothetical protein